MNLHHRPGSIANHTHGPTAVQTLASSSANEEYSREFGEFIQSISVTAEELAAIVSMPDLSVAEIKQHLRGGKNGGPQTNQDVSGRAVPQVVVKIRLPGARSLYG